MFIIAYYQRIKNQNDKKEITHTSNKSHHDKDLKQYVLMGYYGNKFSFTVGMTVARCSLSKKIKV